MKNVFEVLTFCIIELRKLEEIAKKEANELISIFVSSIKTSKNNS